MGRSLITHLVILQALSLGLVAWADASRESRADRNPAGLARIESQQSARVALRGSLACPMAESNTGSACQLSFTPSDKGKTLRINESNSAMRLFHEGKTDVIATGTIQGDSFRIIEIKPDESANRQPAASRE